jgi:molybdate transport system substrate-binding protein
MATLARQFVLVSALLVLAAQASSAAGAVEIKALITIGFQSALEDLAPKFEKASGHKLAIEYGLSAALSKRVADGEQTDVIIGTRESVDGLIKAGKISAGSDATVASSGFGIAVRMGAPKPDISTPDALKRSLLAARMIGYGNPAAGGAAGVHFIKFLESLGIVEEMKAKTKYPIPGAFVGSMLVSGEVDLAVQSIPELNFVKGVDLVGPLPGDLQVITNYAVAISASAKQPDAARTLVLFLRSPEAVTFIKAKGFDPG